MKAYIIRSLFMSLIIMATMNSCSKVTDPVAQATLTADDEHLEGIVLAFTELSRSAVEFHWLENKDHVQAAIRNVQSEDPARFMAVTGISSEAFLELQQNISNNLAALLELHQGLRSMPKTERTDLIVESIAENTVLVEQMNDLLFINGRCLLHDLCTLVGYVHP